VAIVEKNLVDQQELLTQAQGETILGLVETYRALGGGWRNGPQPALESMPTLSTDPVPELLPTPAAEPVAAPSKTTWKLSRMWLIR
jgi:hypothetical protein